MKKCEHVERVITFIPGVNPNVYLIQELQNNQLFNKTNKGRKIFYCTAQYAS